MKQHSQTTIHSKVCGRCFIRLHKTEFYKDRQRRDGLQSFCKKCKRATSRKYKRKWNLNNKHKLIAEWAFKRAGRRKRTPSWLTKEQREDIKFMYKQAYETTVVSGESWHVDHIVPMVGVNVSGLHVPWNLQLLPAVENLTKGRAYTGLDAWPKADQDAVADEVRTLRRR